MTIVCTNPSKAMDRQMEHNTISELEGCMINIKSWMDQTRLKMNPSKIEFINFGSRQQLAKYTYDTINIAGDLILRSDVIRYLGVWMDKELNFKQHVTKKCLCAMINYKRIQSIRHLLNTKTTESLCLSLCISHLDYCNSILYGLPMVTLNKLQRVQNMCAWLVLRKSKYDSALGLPKEPTLATNQAMNSI